MRRRSLLTLALTAGSAVGASLVSDRDAELNVFKLHG